MAASVLLLRIKDRESLSSFLLFTGLFWKQSLRQISRCVFLSSKITLFMLVLSGPRTDTIPPENSKLLIKLIVI